MPLEVISTDNFEIEVGGYCGLYVLLIHDFYPETGSRQIAQRAAMEFLANYYERHKVPYVKFGHGDSVDRSLLASDAEVRKLPTTIWYYDGFEVKRLEGFASPDYLKMVTEEYRT